MHVKSRFQFMLCPTREPDRKYIDIYKSIYQCWYNVWKLAYTEIKGTEDENLYSDDFTRQDFAAAILYEQKCVGVILFRYIDIDLESHRQDSYFEQWSEIHLKSLLKSGSKFMICSHLSVSPEFRKNALGVSMKDLMVAFIAEVTLHSDVDATISTPRRNKNVHNMTQKWGATTIAENINWGYDVQVDLVAFYKENLVLNKNEDLQSLIEHLWEEKKIIRARTQPAIESFELAARYGNNLIPLKKVAG